MLNPRSFKFRLAASYILLFLLIMSFITTGFIISKQNKSPILKESTIDIKLIQTLYALSSDLSNSNTVLKDFIVSEDQKLPNDRKAISSEIELKLKLLGDIDTQVNKAEIKKISTTVRSILQAQEGIEHFIKEGDQASEATESDIDGNEQEDITNSESIDLQNIHSAYAKYRDTIQPLVTAHTHQVTEIISGLSNEDEEDETRATGYLNMLLPVLLLAIFGIFFFSFIYNNSMIQSFIADAKKPLQILSSGNLPEAEKLPENELGEIMEEINVLTKNLGKIKDFALEVGSGHYESQISIFNNEGVIGKSLFEMRNSLRQIASDEKERNWLNEGFAKFSDVLRQNGDNLELLSQNVVSQLVKYLNANQGGIFILNDENKERLFLELTACYAYDRAKYHKRQIMVGEGLIGQCFLEKKSIYMTDVPEDYINIKSGLGGSNPDNIFIVPLMINQEVFGIIELASFNRFTKIEMEFIEKAAESIASTISSVKITENTKKLLETSQMVTEQLKSQEEEMRQNMEELAATQEEMHRNQKGIIENEQKTHLIFLNAFDAIVTTDEQGTIDLFNPAAEKIFGYTADEIKGLSIDILVTEEYALNNRDTGTLNGTKDILKIIGAAREVIAKNKNGEQFKIKLKIEEGRVGGQKIYLAFIENMTLIDVPEIGIMDKEDNLVGKKKK